MVAPFRDEQDTLLLCRVVPSTVSAAVLVVPAAAEVRVLSYVT
jgi:hypothetical protein